MEAVGSGGEDPELVNASFIVSTLASMRGGSSHDFAFQCAALSLSLALSVLQYWRIKKMQMVWRGKRFNVNSRALGRPDACASYGMIK